MEFIRAVKLLEPRQKIRRQHWPSWCWVYLTPVGFQLKFRGRAGVKLAFDTLALEDTVENDWWINGVASK